MGREKDPTEAIREEGYDYMRTLRGDQDLLSGRSFYQPTTYAGSSRTPEARRRAPQTQTSTATSSNPDAALDFIRSRTTGANALPNTTEGYLQLMNEMQAAGHQFIRPYRGRGLEGPQSEDKLVIGDRMYDVMGDQGWQLADIGSAAEHGYAPGNITGVYQGSGGSPGFAGGSFGPGYLGGLQGALSGFGDFAQTGGFSPQDIQNIRARANAPIRAMYQHGKDELERAKNLQGGYMPNYAPALAKMTREQSYAAGDQSLNTEAMLSEARRSGRLSGLTGMSNLGLGMSGQSLDLARIMAGQTQDRDPNSFGWRDAAGLGLGALALFSDRNAKKDIKPIDSKNVLRNLKRLPISEWTYKDDPEQKRHIGPMAQDFKRIFKRGGDGRSIDLVDAIGVNLAANKALAEKLT